MNECVRCGAPATQKVRWVVSSGLWGTHAEAYYCDEHLAELVRITNRRYEIFPLAKAQRRNKMPEGQTALDV